MLRSIDEIRGYSLQAIDGEIGKCKDVLFHDSDWTVRYIVADTGRWIPERRVLIPAGSLGPPDWWGRRLHVELTTDEVEAAPSTATDEPVSRRREAKFFRNRGYKPYWGAAGVWGGVALPYWLRDRLSKPREGNGATETDTGTPSGDPHLRSVAETLDYEVEAADGSQGHVEDFIMDDEAWRIRYVVVDTRNWLPSRKVIVPTDHLSEFRWGPQVAELDLTRDGILSAPDYRPGQPVNVEYETRLYDYRGRPVNWA